MRLLPIRLSKPQQLLCDVLQAGDERKARSAVKSLRNTMGDEAAFQFAERHEVACIAGHHLLGSHEPADEKWQRAHERTGATISAYLQELDKIAELFEACNTRVVALKNGGIARALYPCAGCCPMGDLDLLVSPINFAAAHRLLVDRGYEFEFRHAGLEADLEEAIKSGSTEYFRTLATGDRLWIDFQCRPVAGKWIQPDQEPDADELLERAVPISNSRVRLLAPEDNLLQVALHTAKHSYVRAPGLRLHTDVDRIVTHYQQSQGPNIDWQLFEQKVSEYNVKVPVYFSLALAKQLLGTQIPLQLLERLRPRRWKQRVVSRWIQAAGIFEPQRRKFGRFGYMAFTALQYDNWSSFGRAVFPTADQVRSQFPGEKPLLWLYIKRLKRLLWRRFST